MSKDTAVAKDAFFREVFQVGLYKPAQGKVARQVTFAVIAVVAALAAWRLQIFLTAMSVSMKAAWLTAPVTYVVAGLVLFTGVWLAYRIVNWAKFADFLIAVEAEMAKVSWPSRMELYRQSIVVIAVIFILVFLLFAFDLIWGTLFEWVGVIRRT